MRANQKALMEIAKQLIVRNVDYMQDLANQSATRRTDTEGGYHHAFMDGVSVGLACCIGMVVDGSLKVDELKGLLKGG